MFIKSFLRRSTFLALIFSLLIFQTEGFAEGIFLNSAEEYRQKGYEAQQKGLYEQALTLYNKAIALGGATPAVHNDVGVIYEQMGMADKAEWNYLRAIGMDPAYLPSYTNLAYLYRSQGDIKKAEHYFEKRLERSKGTDDPWAEKIRRELLKMDPQKYQKYGQNTKKLDENVVKEKRERVYKDFSLDIVRAEKHYQKGQEYLKEKEFKKAVTELDRALAVTPNNPKILKAREDVMYQQAVETIKQKTGNALQDLEVGNVKSARQEFQEILSTIPESNPNEH